MNRISQSFLGAAMLLAASIAACSSDDPGAGPGGGGSATCDQNPFQCPATETCWVADANLHFACFQSGSGRIGDACQNETGQPTCGDGMICIQVLTDGSVAASGVCTPYCNSSHACPNGEACINAQLQSSVAKGPIIQVCNPPAPAADGGSDATSDGATDAPGESAPPVDAHEASTDATGQ